MYDYHVQSEADQSMLRTKLPLSAYSTETCAAVGAWVLLEPNNEEQTGGTESGRAGKTVIWDLHKQMERCRSSVAGGER